MLVYAVGYGNNKDTELIQKILKKKQIAFGSIRTDRNIVSELTQNNGALYKPRERQIIEAIDRLSKDSSTDNIKFLLNIVANITYGVRKGSYISHFLNNDSSIKDKHQKQNVDWETILKTAITKALKDNNTNEKHSLLVEFEKLFPNEPENKQPSLQPFVWLSVDKNLQLEKKLISLRKDILVSSEYINSQDNKNKAKIIKHLDYFIASSETSYEEKVKCLEALSFMISDKYKLNEQLSGKKVQILSEILNDLVIKTPESPVLTIKEMSQGPVGMCAAISSGSKAMAHERKYAHVSNLMALLDSSPTMQIYDVTDPELKDKITLKKANLNYKEAISVGFRIIDAAITNFMQFADQMGNGLTSAGNYVPFDPEHYGMFDDSHLLLDMEPELQSKYNVFRATIKLKEVINSIKLKTLEAEDAKKELIEVENNNAIQYPQYRDKAKEIFNEMASKSDVHQIINSLNSVINIILDPLALKNQVDIEINDLLTQIKSTSDEITKSQLREKIVRLQKEKIINPNEGPNVQKAKLTNLINIYLPGIKPSLLDEKIDEIYDIYSKTAALKAKENGLKSKFSLKSKVALQKKLFNLAAFQRVKKEFEVEDPESLKKLAKQLNVTPDKDIVLKTLENKGLILPRNKLDDVYKTFKSIDLYKHYRYQKGDDGWMPESRLYASILEQKNIFKQIEKTFTSIERETKRDFNALRKELEPQLKELYDKKARGAGDYWTSMEGSSGLSTDQYSRLRTQLTGENHRVTHDPKEFVGKTHEGVGGVIGATNVNDDEFSGHAQYGYDAKKEENIINPDMGKVEKQMTFYNDNTWGPIEDKVGSSWTDDAGHKRTNYGDGTGGADGFLLDPSSTQGNAELKYITGTGIHKPGLAGKAWAKKLDKYIGQEFPIFMDGVLRGEDFSAPQKAEELMDKLFDLANGEAAEEVDVYFQRIMEGNIDEIDNMARELSINISNATINALEARNLRGLKREIDNTTKLIINQHPSKLFITDGREILNNELIKKIIPAVKNVLNSHQSNMTKKIKVAEEIENIVSEVVMSTTKPGIRIYPERPEMINKASEDLSKKLLSDIRGIKPTKMTVDSNTDITKSTIKNGIKTREEFDGLPEKSLIKLLINKMVLMPYCTDDELYVELENAKTSDELKAVKDKIIAERKKNICNFIINKEHEYYDKPITSIKELGKYALGRVIIQWIDLDFNPKSDEDLMQIFSKLQNSDNQSIEKLLAKVKPENIGIKPREPFYVVQLINGLNEKTIDEFNNVVYAHVYSKYKDSKTNRDIAQITKNHKEWCESEEAAKLTTAEKAKKLEEEIDNYQKYQGDINERFKSIKDNLEGLEFGKISKAEKDEAIVQLGVWPAFPELKSITDEEINKSVAQMLDDLEKMAFEFNELVNSKASVTDKSELKTQIKDSLKVFVQGFVRPKHQDDIAHILNEWFKEASKTPGSPKANELRLNIQSKMINDYALKHPVEFFENITNQLARIANSTNPDPVDEEIIEIWKELLTQALHTANKIEIEAQIRSYINESHITQVAQHLRSTDYLTKTDSEETIPIKSDEALHFILTALKDDTNNNSTLKYFIEQTGLTKFYVKFFSSDYWFNGSKKVEIKPEMPLETIKLIEKQSANFNIIQETFENFIVNLTQETENSNHNPLKHKTLEAKIKTNYFGLLDKAFVDKTIEEKNLLDNYKNKLLSFIKFVQDPSNGLLSEDSLTLLLDWQEEVLQQKDNSEMIGIQNALDFKAVLELKLKGIQMLDDLVPEYSELKKEMNNSRELLKTTIEKFDKYIETIDSSLKSKIETYKARLDNDSEELTNNSELNKTEQQVLLQNNALELVNLLLQALNENNKEALEQVVDIIINTENLYLEEILSDTFTETQIPELKFYIAQALGAREEYKSLAEYVENIINNNETLANIQEDQTLLVITESLITASNNIEVKNRAKFSKTLAKLYDAVSKQEQETPLTKQLLEMFVEKMPNQGIYTEKILFNFIVDKNININTRFNAIQLLGMEDTIKYFNLFQEILLKPDRFANNNSEKLLLMNAASGAINNILNNNEGLEYTTLFNNLHLVNADQIYKKAKEERLYLDEMLKENFDGIKNNIKLLLEEDNVDLAA